MVGHSDGASIAAIYAGAHQDHRVAGHRDDRAAFHRRGYLGGLDRRRSRTAYETTELKAKLARWHKDVDNAFYGWNGAWLDPRFRDWDISEYLAYIRVPVAILQGADDQYGTMRQIEIAREECYCPVDVTEIPGAGHPPHREAPGRRWMRSPISQTRCCATMKARRGGPPNAFDLIGDCRDEHPAATRRRHLPLPRWAYVPGEMAEDDADYDTLAQVKALVPSRFRDYVPARHPALRYGLALNDRGYFWEAQEVLEAVWAAAPQGGRERILLRACIQIANANLRLRMQKPHAAARLLGEALDELKALGMRSAGGDGFADGFPVAALIDLLKGKLARPQLTKADWVAFAVVKPDMKQNAGSRVLG